MNIDYVTRRGFASVVQSWGWKDCALYALALGYGSHPLDERELAFVYEQGPQKVVPSFGLVLGWPELWHREPEAGIDWTRILHGEQRLVLHRPLGVSGSVRARYRVIGIQDKGPGRGALLWFDTDLEDALTGEPVAHLRNTQFLREEGGCGDWGETVAPLPPIAPEATPLHSIAYTTLPQAALLYRLSGDTMPLHADPKVARQGGFDRPILHGLANMGLACRAILERFCPADPDLLASMAVRFVAPAYPGETLRVEFVQEAGDLRFRAYSVERELLLLDRGEFRLRGSSA